MFEEFIVKTYQDIKDIEKVPVEERVKENSTYQLIEKGAAHNPDGTAITFLMDGDSYEQPIQINYRDFIGKIRQTANMLNDLGVGPEDVVTFLLPNIPQTHYVLWGGETAGIVNPINPMLEADTIKDICDAAGTKVLVALGELPGTDIWQKVEAIRKDIPSLECVLRVMGPSDEAEKIYGFEEKMAQYSSEELTFERVINRDDIASLYHTGGTTGRPKLARRTHYNELVVSWDICAGIGLKPGETAMVGLPLFHCNGTIITGLAAFSRGANVVMLSPTGYRNPSIMTNFYKIVEKYKPVYFSAVPTVLSVLLDLPVGDADISSLRYLICGAAPLSVELFNRFEKHTGMKIIEGYGLTETAVASSVNPKDGERKIGSVGLPFPYHYIKTVILDENGDFVRECETNEIGVVTIGGPCVFKGYVEDIHNAGIWMPNGYFNTGDMGRIDEDGYLWLTGRKKELIIRGGHNIDPATIEESLYQLKGVKMAAAVGRPDSHAGEVPVAYVELTENSGLSQEDLMEWVKNNIGERAAVPKDIHVIDQVPLTAVGKVFKPALRWDATKRKYEEELSTLGDMIKSVSVEVGEDKVHGTNATINIVAAEGVDHEAIRGRIPELLARYTIHYNIVIQ